MLPGSSATVARRQAAVTGYVYALFRIEGLMQGLKEVTDNVAQTLQMLTMQSLKKVIMQISFCVWEYDLVNQTYYPSFATKVGAAINSSVKPTKAGATGFANSDPTAVFALLGKTSGTEFGIKVGAKAEEDPLGIRNHTLELSLAPPIASAPQQIQIQTSATIKLIQPWGLPQK